MINMGIRRWLKANAVILSLTAVILFYIINNYIWLNQSLSLNFFEIYGCYFGDTWEFYKHLLHFDISKVMDVFRNSTSSFYNFTAALIAIISGKSFIAVNLLNNLLYFIIAIISTFQIGQKIADKNTGLMAAVIFSLYPAIFRMSRYFMLEFGLVGMVAFSIWCLLKTEGFYDRKYSLLFGLSVGLGMIVKYSFAVFIMGPLVYIMVTALFPLSRIHDMGSKKYASRMFNVVFASLICLVIMSVRYNFEYVKDILMRGSYYAAPWYDFKNIRICTSGLIEHQISLFFFVLVILVVYSFLLRTEKKVKIILLLWIFVPWLIFTIVPHPNSVKYITPCLPAIALLSTIGFMKLLSKKRKFKYCLIGLIVIVGVIQYYDASFGLGLNLHRYKMRINNSEIHVFFTDDKIGEMWNRPRDFGSYGKIVSVIRKSMGSLKKKVLIYAFCDPDLEFGARYPVWYAFIWFTDLPFEVRPVMADACGGLFGGNILRTSAILQGLQQADFILYYGPSPMDIKDPSYIDELLINRVRSDLQAHKKKEKFLILNQFLKSKDLRKFKKQFQEIINNFILIEEIVGLEEYGKPNVYLYEENISILNKTHNLGSN